VNVMNRRDFVSLLLAPLAPQGHALEGSEVPIVISQRASSLEKFAAAEFAERLGRLFPGYQFRVIDGMPASRSFIRLGTLEDSPQLSQYVSKSDLAQAESFVVTSAQEGQAWVGIIAGADARATLFAVYALLEKLGYGFYLSYDAQPDPQPGPCAFDTWQLVDAPLAGERILFNWHNFLSGCSGWDLADWQHWASQAAKMRFNSIMVHAYGNNPMFSFTHNGQRKPTGFLTSSVRGRDWGAEHVNDVRRIYGGEELFQSPVWGSSAGLVREEETVEAATRLMQQVFAFARSRGLGVNFALDVDTHSANPQNVIATLPENARFRSGNYLLPNPEIPEGLAYYQSQVQQLLSTYPEIDRIVMWFREPGSPWSPWRDLPPAHFPPPWQTEYQQALAKFPSLAQDRQSPGLFALSKIAKAFRTCLNSLGKSQVRLALGSWEFRYLRAADVFMSPDVEMFCIHQWNTLGKGQVQDAIRNVSSRRKVIPIPYAQDDDGAYAGRPYTPPAGFATWLEQSGCAGYGILHWTTRPLDLYHKSLSQQVWRNSRDQRLRETCEQMAERTFGSTARASGGEYLWHWIREAPLFGRDTTDRFIDRPLPDAKEVAARSRRRLEILEAMPSSSLSPQAAQWRAYFRDWERFVTGFFHSQAAWVRSVESLKSNAIAQAQQALSQCKPEEVLEQYARMAARLGITSGEKGLLLSMNLRWLPYIVSQRQALGLDSIRVKFGPTEQEPLAQLPGIYTFFIDRDRRLWLGWGERETGLPASAQSATPEELRESSLEVDKALSTRLRCMMGESLLEGNYDVKLLFLPPALPDSEAMVDLQLRGSSQGPPVKERLTLRQELADGLGVIPTHCRVHVDQGYLQLDVIPAQGKPLLCGVVLEPRE
jgi:hypothetical protein